MSRPAPDTRFLATIEVRFYDRDDERIMRTAPLKKVQSWAEQVSSALMQLSFAASYEITYEELK